MLKQIIGSPTHVRKLSIRHSKLQHSFTGQAFRKARFALLIGILLPLATPVLCNTVLLNFDSVDTSAASHEVNAAPYFAAYGISVSTVSPTVASLDIVLDRAVYDVCAPGHGCVIAASEPNVLELCCFADSQSSTGSFTLQFSQPISNLSFQRPEIVPGISGIITPAWTATAYGASGNVVGSVGEGFDSTYSPIPAVTFSLPETGIASITFATNNGDFAALSNIPIDNLQFNTTTPEPASIALMGIGAVLFCVCTTRRRSRGVLQSSVENSK